MDGWIIGLRRAAQGNLCAGVSVFIVFCVGDGRTAWWSNREFAFSTEETDRVNVCVLACVALITRSMSMSK